MADWVKPYFWETLNFEEAKSWKQTILPLEEHFYDTPPKQEALIEYVRARIEMRPLEIGRQIAATSASNNPGDEFYLKLLHRWDLLLGKKRAEVDRLRVSCGLSNRHESNLRKNMKLRAGEDDVEKKPWEIE